MLARALGVAAAAVLAWPLAGGAATGPAAEGRALFVEGCSTCHGLDARGVPGLGPSLHGVGAQAADFYLRTGRMPLDKPGNQPLRSKPHYAPAQIDALVAYVASLGGPPVPVVEPERGNLSRGQRVYAEFCAGCHQAAGAGGIVTGGIPPELHSATPTQVAEAVRIGPYLMPAFTDRQIDDRALDDLARYVEYTKEPRDDGGWALGHVGPVAEGMVTWLLGLVALLLFTRLLGERIER